LYSPNIFGEAVLTVTGSRSITDRDFIFASLNDFLKLHNLSPSKLTLNSGHARGVDLIAEDWAKELNIPIERFYPDWRRYNKAAGMIRNKVMVDCTDYVCGIWDGISTGTKGCIEYAEEKGKIVKVYDYNK